MSVTPIPDSASYDPPPLTSLNFYLNGKPISLTQCDPSQVLLNWLRENHNTRLTGSKLGCGEGGCGACTVTLSHFDKETKKVM